MNGVSRWASRRSCGSRHSRRTISRCEGQQLGRRPVPGVGAGEPRCAATAGSAHCAAGRCGCRWPRRSRPLPARSGRAAVRIRPPETPAPPARPPPAPARRPRAASGASAGCATREVEWARCRSWTGDASEVSDPAHAVERAWPGRWGGPPFRGEAAAAAQGGHNFLCCSAGSCWRTRCSSAMSSSAMAIPGPVACIAITWPQGSMTMLWPQVRRPFSCRPPWALAIT